MPGFLDLFQRVLQEAALPLEISRVRLARDPLRTVSRGALVAAVSAEKKSGAAPPEEPTRAPGASTTASPLSDSGRAETSASGPRS